MTVDRSTRGRFLARAGASLTGVAAGVFQAVPAYAASPRRDADAFSADVATAWFDVSLDLVRTTPGYSPPVAARAFAYAGLALYDAVVPGMAGYRPVRRVVPDGPQPVHVQLGLAHDWPSVANAALAAILRALFRTASTDQRTAIDALERRLGDERRARVPARVHTRSVERGRAVAAAIFEWSRTDGGHEGYLTNFPAYTPPAGPGLWLPTPPAFLGALQPFWGRNRCFALHSGAAVAPGDHPPFREVRARRSTRRRERCTTSPAG